MRFLRPGSNASRSLLKDSGSMERSEELLAEIGSWIDVAGGPDATDMCAPAVATRRPSAKLAGQRPHVRLCTCEHRHGDEERPPHDHCTVRHVPVTRATEEISHTKMRGGKKGVTCAVYGYHSRERLL
jgi:hypothetical protein